MEKDDKKKPDGMVHVEYSFSIATEEEHDFVEKLKKFQQEIREMGSEVTIYREGIPLEEGKATVKDWVNSKNTKLPPLS